MKYGKWQVKHERLCIATTLKVKYTPSNGESPVSIFEVLIKYRKWQVNMRDLHCHDLKGQIHP